jgi:hypothetical protein
MIGRRDNKEGSGLRFVCSTSFIAYNIDLPVYYPYWFNVLENQGRGEPKEESVMLWSYMSII